MQTLLGLIACYVIHASKASASDHYSPLPQDPSAAVSISSWGSNSLYRTWASKESAVCHLQPFPHALTEALILINDGFMALVLISCIDSSESNQRLLFPKVLILAFRTIKSGTYPLHHISSSTVTAFNHYSPFPQEQTMAPELQ
eukprot:gnl/MRDRNA2_/MRDRNA2_50786_c0_seq1.p1 gnl/MRDRNA2_/MRDRNA2_50786_c0~~gnl/MRDRNA2_/MRDRNA2_50786_c0_seq1.p1  ORF type:complete len:144 (+),score=18.33 gnl/MRDRNA2_/MRDRNA2_50786_c0_seq1:161-592(+)